MGGVGMICLGVGWSELTVSAVFFNSNHLYVFKHPHETHSTDPPYGLLPDSVK